MVTGDDKINRLVESNEGVSEFSYAIIGESHGLDIFVGIPAVVCPHISGVPEVDKEEIEIFGGCSADCHFDDVVVTVGDVGTGVAIVDGGGIGEADFAEGWNRIKHPNLLVSLGEEVDEGGDCSLEAVELCAFGPVDVWSDSPEEGLLSGKGEVWVDGSDGKAGCSVSTDSVEMGGGGSGDSVGAGAVYADEDNHGLVLPFWLIERFFLGILWRRRG